MPTTDRQQHARAYKHAKAIFAARAPKEPTNTERKRTGRAFTVQLTTDEDRSIPCTFHLDPLFRVSCSAVQGIASCSAKPIQTRLAMIRTLIHAQLPEVLDFRSFTLLTAALSFDPATP